MNKYSTKRTSSNCNNFDSFSKHRRDYTPPGRRSHSRNSSPESWSPRGPSSYSSKTTYSRRSKERERESKYYDGASKSKYMRLSRSRSPIVHEPPKSYKNSSGHSRDSSSYYENNHSSSYSTMPSKRNHFGDWTEQISSSGKRYYYNSKSETSQWEKPRDWLDWERRYASKYSTSSADKYASNSYRDKYDSNSSNPKSYAYSNDSYPNRDKGKDVYNSSRNLSPNYRSHNSRTKDRDSEKRTLNSSSFGDLARKSAKVNNSTSDNYSYKKTEPSSCPLKSTDSQSNILNNNHTHKNDKIDSPNPPSVVNNSNSNHKNSSGSSSSQKMTTNYANSNTSTQPGDLSQSSELLSTLATLLSSGQPLTSITKLLATLNIESASNDDILNIQKVFNAWSQKSQNSSSSNHSNSKLPLHSPRNSTPVSHHQATTSSPPSQSKHYSSKSHSISRHLNSGDGSRPDIDQLSKGLILSPTLSQVNEPKSAAISSRSENASTASTVLSTISSVINSSAAQKSTVPNLSRFKFLYREDLVAHVTGWNTEQLEKQVCTLLMYIAVTVF